MRSRALACLAAFSALASAAPAGAVVIHEVHYNPTEGPHLEFVELYNPASVAADLSGWSLRGGIRYDFPEGRSIAPGGYLVVCRDRAALARHFAIALEAIEGEYAGSLDNAGDRLRLVDARGVLVDTLRYDDRPPWDMRADGGGASIERLCPGSSTEDPWNWAASVESGPTPLAAGGPPQCPPARPQPPRVVIHEIYYHPLGDRDEELEYVELYNASAEAINLRGWFFFEGISFLFEQDTVIESGAFLLVCRNQEAVRKEFGIENTTGDFAGQLSNDGERLTLVDAEGELADSVRYDDRGDWPVAADGLGHSLEKIVAVAASDDPANWSESQSGDLTAWNTEEETGEATSSRILIYNGSEGEFLIDNISLVRLGQPDVELLPSGTFDAGIEGWIANGSHATSHWVEDGGPDGSGALRLVSTGRGSGRTQGISFDIAPELERSTTIAYRLRLEFRHLSGNPELTFRLSGSSPTRGVFWRMGAGVIASPGTANGAGRAALPPFADHVSRFPEEPTSNDPTTIAVRVRGEDVARVMLMVQVIGGDSLELEMRDDGLSGDREAGDAIYGAELPPFPHASQVTFRVVAESSLQAARTFPPDSDPTGVYGYYVDDLQPASNLPVYTIIYEPGSTLSSRALISALNCQTYRQCSFAYKGDLYYNCEIRRRGQSVCGDPDVVKKFLKLRFRRGNYFRGLRKLNLQSLWTDKSLIREHMAWRNFGELGAPACFHNFVRLHMNGEYFGLYAELEHPDKRFLERVGLNPDGNLYKAVASREEAGSVAGRYEKKTNEDGDYSDLQAFIDELHRTNGTALIDFFREKTDEDAIIDYQLAQVLPNNRDYPHKNHYLYHDTERGKWMPTTWDMDLTYGKRWDGNFEGVLNDLMDNPGITPWYTTRVRGEGTGNHLLDRFFANAGTWYRRAYLVRLWDAIHEKHTLEFYDERIDELRDLLWDEQREDIALWGRSRPSANDPRAPAEFEPNLERVREHLRIRRSYLINYLRGTERFSGHPRLKITELMYNPPGSSEREEFLELWNNSEEAIDVSGWSITGLGARLEDGSRAEFVFPAGSMIADGEVFVVAKDPAAFAERYGSGVRAFGPYPGNLDNRGEDLRVKDTGPGHPATVDWLRYRSDLPWPPAANGQGFSIELTDVSANRDNDLPQYWRASRGLGGSPGMVEGITFQPELFSRGDCTADGRLNVSDAVALLIHLFRGQERVPCQDACDSDGSGKLDLTDAVFLLRFLFVETSMALPSPGPGDCAPASASCEQSTCSL